MAYFVRTCVYSTNRVGEAVRQESIVEDNRRACLTEAGDPSQEGIPRLRPQGDCAFAPPLLGLIT
jgi:hypothetical protein